MAKYKYCTKCGAEIKISSMCCNCCGAEYVNDVFQKRKRNKRTIAVAVMILLCIIPIGLIVWDHADPPLWYHFEAQNNKRVIMEYAEEHFPEAVIVEEHYDSAIPFQTSNKFDYIVYNLDGVEFSIWANDGEFWGENYLGSKAIQYIEDILLDEFFDPRQISAKYNCFFTGNPPVGHISEYEECIYITIFVENHETAKSLSEIRWFYDFYLYWINNPDIKNYDITINYGTLKKTKYSVNFTEKTVFENEDDFYDTVYGC